MSEAGFDYAPDAAFPTDATVAVASNLGVQPSSAVAPTETNRNYVNSLTATEGDRYYQTLLGESKAAIESLESSGHSAPTGSNPDTFATGGCTGSAREAIPGIWSIPRSLEGEMAAMRMQARVPAKTAYKACTAAVDVPGNDPPGLETKIADADPSSAWANVLSQALLECDSVWVTSYRAAEAALAETFIADHVAIFSGLLETYGDALATIAGDGAFLAYLGEASGIAQAAIAADHD